MRGALRIDRFGLTESRSPWNSSPNDPRRAESPGSRRNPSGTNYRNEGGGHLSGHVGKAASSPASLSRKDAVPVVGGENTTPFDNFPRDE